MREWAGGGGRKKVVVGAVVGAGGEGEGEGGATRSRPSRGEETMPEVGKTWGEGGGGDDAREEDDAGRFCFILKKNSGGRNSDLWAQVRSAAHSGPCSTHKPIFYNVYLFICLVLSLRPYFF